MSNSTTAMRFITFIHRTIIVSIMGSFPVTALAAEALPTSNAAQCLRQVEAHIQKHSVTVADFQQLDSLVKRGSDATEARRVLADCYRSAGYLDLAQNETIAGLKNNPDDLLVTLITNTVQEEGLLAGERKLRALQDKYSQSPVRLMLHVQLMLSRGNVWGADHLCDVWQRSQQNTFSLGTARAFVHYQREEYSLALKQLDKDLVLRKDFLPAVTLRKKILERMHNS